MELYTARQTIEVFFKEMKQPLQLGQCQSRDFDAEIAHVTACRINYTARGSNFLNIHMCVVINMEICAGFRVSAHFSSVSSYRSLAR